ncbi:MAG: 3-isopropylmalate dehydrogenase [Candidatus Dormibacteria bacterium]
MTTTTTRRVILLPGDGIGPEVTRAAEAVLRAACAAAGVACAVEPRPVGGAAIDAEGAPISAATVEACRGADAVLLGAVGGPRWDHLRGPERTGAALLTLRRELGLFANLRPVRPHPALGSRSSLRPELLTGVDLVVVRELTGGAYFGRHDQGGAGEEEWATDTTTYSRAEVARVARVAFALARSRRRRLISVDKANVLWSSRLWRDVVNEVAAEFPEVAVEHQYVDSFALRLVSAPAPLDVVLTENLFGDILSDEAAALTGSLGVLPSASLGDGGPGLYEPVHGSAPDIAGRGVANPLGAILSVGLLLEHSLGLPESASAVRGAVDTVVAAGTVTPDLGGRAGTDQVGQAVVDALAARAATLAVGAGR